MRAVVQRVTSARVQVGGEEIARVGVGVLVLVGVADGDAQSDAEYLARKIVELRVFEDDAGQMNRSLADVSGAVLAVSQFTLLADCRKGRRPSFVQAARPEAAEPIFDHFVSAVRLMGVPIQSGRFGADMEVELVNDGPVTLILESKREAASGKTSEV
jgi:D-tyrosyl-tRNA(Tyr) deacylase